MMRRALVYVTSNWEDLIKYRNDGRFTIDNMLAERAVRPFTVKRKNSLFFKSKTTIINGSPAPVYKGLEAIESLRFFLLDILYLVRLFRNEIKLFQIN